ncbi:MAG: Thiol-disulfide oxidoreductase ResA [Candidatus Heimdallarchaeota archaeon LC_2]|nr:MAG: Thiol-disulfide oxidoreductase ResA [Candidatus Heimdallarchaeota archaeon LC_2]
MKAIYVLIVAFSLVTVPTAQGYSLEGSFLNIDNEDLNYSLFDGNVLLIDATASWCTACDTQLQNLNKVYDSVDSRVTIVTLSIDKNDDIPKVAELKTRFDSQWIFALDSGLDFLDQFEVAVLPTLFLFNEDGSIFKKWEGVTTPTIILDAINEHFIVPFDAAFNTNPGAEVGSLFEDLFANTFFRMVGLMFIVIFVYLKISPSKPTK